MERDMYERESMQAMAGLGAAEDDWDDVERQHLHELAVRGWLKKAAAAVLLMFSVWQIYKQFAPKRQSTNAPCATPTKQPTAKEPEARTPTATAEAPVAKAAAEVLASDEPGEVDGTDETVQPAVVEEAEEAEEADGPEVD